MTRIRQPLNLSSIAYPKLIEFYLLVFIHPARMGEAKKRKDEEEQSADKGKDGRVHGDLTELPEGVSVKQHSAQRLSLKQGINGVSKSGVTWVGHRCGALL